MICLSCDIVKVDNDFDSNEPGCGNGIGSCNISNNRTVIQLASDFTTILTMER